MQTDLTHGKITVNMLLFALPLMAGNPLAADVQHRRYLGSRPLYRHRRPRRGRLGVRAHDLSYVNSFRDYAWEAARRYLSGTGQKKKDSMRNCIFLSFVFISVLAVLLNAGVYFLGDAILVFLRVPVETRPAHARLSRYHLRRNSRHFSL